MSSPAVPHHVMDSLAWSVWFCTSSVACDSILDSLLIQAANPISMIFSLQTTERRFDCLVSDLRRGRVKIRVRVTLVTNGKGGRDF